MSQLLLLLVVALVAGGIVFGVAALMTGSDPGLADVDPDGHAVPLPGDRPLAEPDLSQLRFDTGLRGYRADQVDAAIERLSYDVGYKQELISVLESEVSALRAGRQGDADALRDARRQSSVVVGGGAVAVATAPVEPDAPSAESQEPTGTAGEIVPESPAEDAPESPAEEASDDSRPTGQAPKSDA
ncbi:DivIVA domain-containing protein [Longispora sp. NPDC051575]|uniref:DivIVA domain-containing protein n=1 Tax=Longispora sp. NPDC051575 TaxID=3154943 RepID=UPI003446B8AC